MPGKEEGDGRLEIWREFEGPQTEKIYFYHYTLCRKKLTGTQANACICGPQTTRLMFTGRPKHRGRHTSLQIDRHRKGSMAEYTQCCEEKAVRAHLCLDNSADMDIQISHLKMADTGHPGDYESAPNGWHRMFKDSKSQQWCNLLYNYFWYSITLVEFYVRWPWGWRLEPLPSSACLCVCL